MTNLSLSDRMRAWEVVQAANRAGSDVISELNRAGLLNTEHSRIALRAETISMIADALDKMNVVQIMGQPGPATGEDVRKRLIELLEGWYNRELKRLGS